MCFSRGGGGYKLGGRKMGVIMINFLFGQGKNAGPLLPLNI